MHLKPVCLDLLCAMDGTGHHRVPGPRRCNASVYYTPKQLFFFILEQKNQQCLLKILISKHFQVVVDDSLDEKINLG